VSTAAKLLPSPAPSHKACPLAAWPEGDVLALIGDTIGRSYPVGSASRWNLRAGSVAEKRIAECIAGIVHAAAGDDPLARRVAITAACHAAALPAAPLRELSAAAMGCAIIEIDGEIAEVASRLAMIRATRSRGALAKVARQRAVILPDLRRLDREIAALQRDIAHGEAGADGDAGRWAAKWCRRRNLPRLEARAAKLRASLPSYRLSAGKRERLAQFSDRLRRLRAARRALQRAARNLGSAKDWPIPAEAAIAAAA
jgi:hypothetical protein